MLRIELGNPAKRFLKKCDKNLYERLISEIKSLSNNQFPQDVKRVVGRKEKVLGLGLVIIELHTLWFMNKILS